MSNSSNEPLSSKQFDALPRGQFAAGVLRLDALFAAAEFGAGAPLFEGIQDVLHCPPLSALPRLPGFGGRSNTAFWRAETAFAASGTAAGRPYIQHPGESANDGYTPTPPAPLPAGVRTLLRLEGLALFVGMTLLYGLWEGSWWVYVILFLAPDISFAAYLAGPRAGAIIYNAAHSYLAPMALMTTGFAASPLVLSIAMIWLAHIGIDRALGYGLKYAAGFGFTHLGRIGNGRGLGMPSCRHTSSPDPAR